MIRFLRQSECVLLDVRQTKLGLAGQLVSSKLEAAGELARKHGISPDRAQMLIDRLGHDSDRLEQAAKDLRINPKIGK